MLDKKVRIDENLLNKIKEFRRKKENLIRYPSDKHFIQIATLELLKRENGEKN
jgi:hypothetical protein